MQESKRCGFIPWVGKSPWRGDGNPLQFSCLENSIDRGLASYSPKGHKKLDMTEHTHILDFFRNCYTLLSSDLSIPNFSFTAHP